MKQTVLTHSEEDFNMTTLEDIDCKEGVYIGDDDDGLGREPCTTGWGVCSQCGEQGYLFGHIVVGVDEECVIDETDVCCDCVTELIEKVMSDSDTGEDN